MIKIMVSKESIISNKSIWKVISMLVIASSMFSIQYFIGTEEVEALCSATNIEVCNLGLSECIACPSNTNNGCSESEPFACCTGSPQYEDPNANNSGCHCSTPGCGGDNDGPPPCTCTATCVAPNQTGFTFTTPALTVLNQESVINWKTLSEGEWGADQTPAACSNNSCPFTGYSGTGYYKLFHRDASGLRNITDYCYESTNSDENAYIIGTNGGKCTLKKFDPDFMGKDVEFVVRAYNNLADACQPAEASRTFRFLSSQYPSCLSINAYSNNAKIVTRPYGKFLSSVLDKNKSLGFTAYVTDDILPPPNGYGKPDVQICFSVAGQSTAFYQMGQLAWQCTPRQLLTTTFKTLSGYEFPLATIVSNYQSYMQPHLNQVSALLSPSSMSLANIIEAKGLIASVNVFDNYDPYPPPDDRRSPNICTANPGYNEGYGQFLKYFPGPLDKSKTCVAHRCNLYLHNRPPEITYLYPSDPTTPWVIGTLANEIPTIECQDNNPYTAQISARDPDGSTDIDNIEYNIAQTWAATPTQTYPDSWPARALFSYDGDDFGGNQKVFALRDANPASPSNCFVRSGTSWSQVAKLPDHINCYKMPDGHNWRGATSVPGVVYLDNKPYWIYYLSSDIVSYANGRMTTMKGNALWYRASFVAYSALGNDVKANFILELAGDGGKSWHGDYNGVWRVKDWIGEDGISRGVDSIANISGEVILQPNGKAYHKRGIIRIDLEPPVYTKKLSYFNATGSRLIFDWTLSDTSTRVRSAKGHLKFASNPTLDVFVQDTAAIASLDKQIKAQYYPYTSRDYLSNFSLWNKTISYPSTSKATPSTESRIEYVDVTRIKSSGTYTFSVDGSDAACNTVSATVNKTSTVINAVCGETCVSTNSQQNGLTCLQSTACTSSSATKCWVNSQCPNESSCDCIIVEEPAVCRGFCDTEGEYDDTGNLWCKRTTTSQSVICPPDQQYDGCLIWVNPDCTNSEDCVCEVNCAEPCDASQNGLSTPNGELTCRTSVLDPMGLFCPAYQDSCQLWMSSDPTCNEFDCNCEETEISCGNTCSQTDIGSVVDGLRCSDLSSDMIVCPQDDPLCYIRWCPADEQFCNCSTEPPPIVDPIPEKNWMLTTGGFVYVDKGFEMVYPNFDPLTTTLNTSLPGKFSNYAVDKIGFSTEWYGSDQDSLTISNLRNTDTSGIFLSANTMDESLDGSALRYSDKNKSQGLYSEFRNKVSKLPGTRNFSDKYTLAEKICESEDSCIPGESNLTLSDLSVCGVADSKICILSVEGYKSVQLKSETSSFVCERKALIFIDTDLMIENQVDIDSIDTLNNGCIFIVKGDVEILGMDNKGSTVDVMNYDRLHNLIVSEGDINIMSDTTGNIYDGLYIKGSLISTNGKILFERDIQNDLYPSFLIEYDPRYLKIYREIFKDSHSTVARELGGR